MKLEFLFAPTSDLDGSLALYRDAFGCTEVWREGESTVALTLPGTETQLMLDANDPTAPSGPLFVVESVATFHSARPTSLQVIADPAEIPGGYLAVYQDPGGGAIYVMDQSTDAKPSRPNQPQPAGIAVLWRAQVRLRTGSPRSPIA